jgi:hypothetical protein
MKDVIAHLAWCESEIAPVLRTYVLFGSDLWNLSNERNEDHMPSLLEWLAKSS